MKKILKKDLITVQGKDCIELLVHDDLLEHSDSCGFCDYCNFDPDDLIGVEDFSCSDFHGCDDSSSSYFVLLDLKSLIL